MIRRAELEDQLRQAMRSGDDLRKRVLRMVLSAVQLAEVDRRGALDDAGMLAVLQKEVKARHESIADAEKAGRPELTLASRAELDVLQGYLPEPLGEAELESLVRAAIAATGAAGPQDIGRVMKEMTARVEGRADGKTISTVVRRLLESA